MSDTSQQTLLITDAKRRFALARQVGRLESAIKAALADLHGGSDRRTIAEGLKRALDDVARGGE